MFKLNEDGTITRLVSYEDEQKWLIKRGKELAKKEGIKETQINTVKELLKEGSLSTKTIAKITKLSEEEIIKIQEKL